jgi:hypothetical protein
LAVGFNVRAHQRGAHPAQSQKKADVTGYFPVSGHIGILLNQPPGSAGLPLNQSSNNFVQTQTGFFEREDREDSALHEIIAPVIGNANGFSFF